MFKRILQTSPDKSVIIIRIMVGVVFLSEGIQKFLFPEKVGVGRFIKIGLPSPAFFANLVGVFEIACGLLILAGLITRLAALPLIIIMLVAIAFTKIPMGMEEGFWTMMHGSRNDWAMLLGSIFLLIKGGSRWSADYHLQQRNRL